MECGGGDPRIVFLPKPTRFSSAGSVALPSVRDRSLHEAVVAEDRSDWPERRIIVDVLADGTWRFKGEPQSRAALEEEFWKYREVSCDILYLRADARAPWRRSADLIALGREYLKTVLVAYALGDPGIGLESILILPPPGKGAVRVRPESPHETWGEMFRKIATAVREGATGIVFE